jgi:putative ATP-dependent endonuclease of OLD family
MPGPTEGDLVRVLQLTIEHFRGYREFEMNCTDNVLLIGEPGAGRTDVISAINKVLDPNSTRAAVEAQDFFLYDITRPIRIELTLGELGAELQQYFERSLEVWNHATRKLLEKTSNPAELDDGNSEWVLRLGYFARWNPDDERFEQWTYFPKHSSPTDDRWDRPKQADRLLLPFYNVSANKPLQVRPDGQFRKLLEMLDTTGSLIEALETIAADVESITARLSKHPAVLAGLQTVIDPLRPPLGIPATTPSADEIVRFAPDGGTLSGLLRTLAASLNLQDGAGFLPLRLQGSTAAAMLAGSEALALSALPSAIVVYDDFGEGLDATTTEYLAGKLRSSSGQSWISTRRPEAGRQFEPSEIIRLTGRGNSRRAWAISSETLSSRRAILRQLNIALLPAMTGRTLLICEGPHDAACLNALANREHEHSKQNIPAAVGARFIESGGIEQIPKLANLAGELGFRVVAILDHDKPGPTTEANLRNAELAADAVVRLPERFAIEKALVYGIEGQVLREAMDRLRQEFELPWPDPTTLNDEAVEDHLIGNLKGRGGLHTAFIDLLPVGTRPRVAMKLLNEAVRLASSSETETVRISADS